MELNPLRFCECDVSKLAKTKGRKLGNVVLQKENCDVKIQASVVQTMDSAVHRINHYPADKH